MSSPEGVSPGPIPRRRSTTRARRQDALIAQEDFKQSWPGFDLAGAPSVCDASSIARRFGSRFLGAWTETTRVSRTLQSPTWT